MNNLIIREHRFEWGKRTHLMGILNVTPDSFSDGGQFNSLETALEQAKNMIDSGADIIDIGGQSTRPGAEEITLEEELKRVIPIIKHLRQYSSIPISIDTTRSAVAQAAIKAGADIVNDISGGTFDEKMLSTVASLQVPIIIMHIRGTPKTMQQKTDYDDLINDIVNWLNTQIKQAIEAGIEQDNIIIDPGIGFAKNYQQNIELLKNLSSFHALGCPMLVGVSRKSFIGHILGKKDPQKRVWGTAAACCHAIASKTDILRVHDVPEIKDIIKVSDALWR
ncbi:dihydropteroate synthase [Crocosphaera watsonii WH 8501]|uniref:Dihydropteroate synthase n=6 Tax=Crocosphaera watsonii TaxID=263511 RepID=Q4BWV4_CROWT|nr:MULTISPECIES: dihydropteroate synthase [Crocosphaera]EAM48387.1 Dihydropteroate synthase [Crocosphaera watsonii WH 8501]EHJ09759.1 Dihydropteroate synthase [Crocosphaera watsonii WH 0003]MCH2244897.1 dihydropteroate synthase [Crocosphaera sp.]NQZ63825.1 dihydropteroate synthase [Crocosphaera sp.]CCQ51171.1 Dihydropteroate synthase [Crocosphaera watsonii WH 8502]